MGNSVSLAVGIEKVTAQDIILAFGKGLTIDTGKSTWEGIKGLFKTETWVGMFDVEMYLDSNGKIISADPVY